MNTQQIQSTIDGLLVERADAAAKLDVSTQKLDDLQTKTTALRAKLESIDTAIGAYNQLKTLTAAGTP